MGRLGILLLFLAVPGAWATGHGDPYYGVGPCLGTTYYPSGPLQPYVSAPPRRFADLPPQPFVVVPEYHQFRDAQLPRVSTEKPQVLIRSFDPELGVYRDAEVRGGEGVIEE
ncbi:hypothetical protein FXN65_19775 [Metapseudomonas lalkuanensis]|uniref:Uncharacterized protein n=1 Tax=Metapseudomonas lalkuanensis TaxID=2604832 RepID=A0A5J6QTY9_9GAMM|nr:hypothetical protein [Pseudomonas lalkuanensis]QEY64189.1 hypothetical protein FXN65_19775 [Pseudomonas lalkuanensis]UCO96806.1 hypothetical protein LF844_19295 [Pseudomonas lalkuanensis]